MVASGGIPSFSLPVLPKAYSGPIVRRDRSPCLNFFRAIFKPAIKSLSSRQQENSRSSNIRF